MGKKVVCNNLMSGSHFMIKLAINILFTFCNFLSYLRIIRFPLLDKSVMVSDESSVYIYKIKIKAQSSQWKSFNQSGQARQVRSLVTVLISVFFDNNGVIHYEFLPPSCTVNIEYYLEVLRRLREAINIIAELRKKKITHGNFTTTMHKHKFHQ